MNVRNSYEYIYDLYRRLEYFDGCLTYCLAEIRSAKICDAYEAIEITNKAGEALKEIADNLGMPGVFDDVTSFMEDNGIGRALRKTGIVIGYDIPYRVIVAHSIYVSKSLSTPTFSKPEWKGLHNLFSDFNPPHSYSRFKFPERILDCICVYLRGEDKSTNVINEINLLEEYKKKLEVIYSYHSHPAFSDFISYTREGRVIVGEGVFSVDAVQQKIDNLKARLITKRKDSTILERQLAVDFMNILHEFKGKQIPAVVSMLMGCGFVNEFLDNRTIFRLWKSFNENSLNRDGYYNFGKLTKRTTSYKHITHDSIIERNDSIRSISHEFIKRVGLQGK